MSVLTDTPNATDTGIIINVDGNVDDDYLYTFEGEDDVSLNGYGRRLSNVDDSDCGMNLKKSLYTEDCTDKGKGDDIYSENSFDADWGSAARKDNNNDCTFDDRMSLLSSGSTPMAATNTSLTINDNSIVLLKRSDSYILATRTANRIIYFNHHTEYCRDQWEDYDALDTGLLGLDSMQHVPSSPRKSGSDLVTMTDVMNYFATISDTLRSMVEEATVKRKSIELKNVVSKFSRRLSKSMVRQDIYEQEQLVMGIALLPFDNSLMHCRMLQTIYKNLTGGAASIDMPRFGAHWEDIGFQGSDPATDLRGVGMLGLVNLVYFSSEERYRSLCCDIFRLSRDEAQQFPFAAVSLNVTRIALLTMKAGKLDDLYCKTMDVPQAICVFYVAVFFLLYTEWKTKLHTVSNTGFVLKDIEQDAMKNTKEFIKKLERRIDSCLVDDHIGEFAEPQGLNEIDDDVLNE